MRKKIVMNKFNEFQRSPQYRDNKEIVTTERSFSGSVTTSEPWSEMRKKLRSKFGKLNDANLNSLENNLPALSSRLQSTYGYNQERADRESDEFSDSLFEEIKEVYGKDDDLETFEDRPKDTPRYVESDIERDFETEVDEDGERDERFESQ